MLNASFSKRVKALVLASMMTGGALFATNCGLNDVRKNIVAGTLDFVQAYSQSVWSGLAPTPTDVFPGDWP